MAETGSLGPPEPAPAQQAEPASSRRPWSPLHESDALIGLGAVIVGLTLTGTIVLALVSGEPAQTLIALVPQGILFVGVPIAIAARRVSSHPWRALGFVKFKASDLWLVAAAMGIQIGVTVVFGLLFFEPEQDTILEDVNFNETTLAVIATVFLIVIAAPITEETLFRGLLFGALRSRAPFWLAAGASGVFFGAVHLATGDVAVAGLLAFFGVILAWLYEKTGSLGPPIALHMINNSLAAIQLLA